MYVFYLTIWIRNKKINRDEGVALVNKYDEEFPSKYFKEMLNICIKEKLEDISMGMSSDYKEAIINGANNIRIGSLLFGEREKNN